MRISRTALPHLLHVEAYETYPAGATFGSAYSIVPSRSPIAPEHTYVSNQKRQDRSAFALTYILRLRSCKSSDAFVISSLPSPMLGTLQMAGPLRSTDITPLHRYYAGILDRQTIHRSNDITGFDAGFGSRAICLGLRHQRALSFLQTKAIRDILRYRLNLDSDPAAADGASNLRAQILL
jgi:hypothetical protein